MQRVLVILCILAGCYEDPDYDPTRFKCDATHACPPGQTCVNGRCTGGSSGVDAPVSTVGVACGSSVCGTGQQCCVDFVVAPRCIASGAACAGIAAACDGSEDCNGSPCCSLAGNDIACGAGCQNQICLDSSDCTAAGATMCCLGFTPGEPWGRCFSNCP